jgi:hypothetical protein
MNTDDDKPSLRMLANSYKILDSSIQTVLSSAKHGFSTGLRSCWDSLARSIYVHRPVFQQPANEISIDTDEIYGKSTERNESSIGLSQVFSLDQSTDDFIPSRTQVNLPCLPVGNILRTEEEMEQRRKLDNPEEMKHVREKLAKYFMDRYKHYTKEQMDFYSKFAQRMKDNTLAFEAFCSTNTIAN